MVIRPSILDTNTWLINKLDNVPLHRSNDPENFYTQRTRNRLKRARLCEFTRHTLLYYLLLTSVVVAEYTAVLAKPIRISFATNTISSSPETVLKKHSLEQSYYKALQSLDLDRIVEKEHVPIWASACLNTQTAPVEDTDDTATRCPKCESPEVSVQEAVHMCYECGFTSSVTNLESCFQDAERVNSNTPYVLDRKAQFKLCINNVLGRSTCSIPNILFKKLEAKMRAHGLLINSKKRHIKFSNVSKHHILIFLKECGFNKFYENVAVIYTKITDKPNVDFTAIENYLLDDYDTLLDEFDKLSASVKANSVINTNIVLYQFLKRYDFPVSSDMFVSNKITSHDAMLAGLFEKLSWTFFHNS